MLIWLNCIILLITDDNLIESNKLLANEIYLDNVNQDYFSTLNTTDINTLENIAFQPGIIGGEAVYRSRALLKLRIEDGAGALRTSSVIKKTIDPPVIRLYPNPANNNVTIESTSGTINAVEVFDSKLSLVKSTGEKRKLVSINTELLSNGLYNVRVRLEDGSIYHVKVSIIH